MEKIKLCCAKCGFTIEEYTASQLADIPQKAKRYKYLLNKASICPSCLASGRLKEVRTSEEGVSAPAPQVQPKSSAAAPVAHEATAQLPTPMMDAVAQGAWPSHATELKRTKYPVQMYEEGLQKRTTQWGYGGYVSLPGVAAGVLVRASARPEITKGSNFVRIMDPCGNFFKTDAMRGLCDIADKYAYGLLHLLSTGGDLEMLGIPTENLKPAVAEITKLGFDVGSTGDDYRTSEECVGPAKCDLALYDTLGFRHAWYRRLIKFLIMASIILAGKEFEVDEDGFIQDPAQWDDVIARALAEQEGITELTEEHWKVIRYLRSYYLQFGVAPMIRKLCKETGFQLKYIYQLFPTGPAKGACKLAGLPKPTGCV